MIGETTKRFLSKQIANSRIGHTIRNVQNQDLGLKWTYFTINIIFRFMWLQPLVWNQKSNTLVYVSWRESRWTHIKWRVTVGFMITFLLAVTVQGFKQFISVNQTSQTDDVLACFNLMAALWCAFFLFIAIHALYHVENIAKILHAILPLYELFRSKCVLF